jgi:carboxyl-terminal processing protease
LVDRVTTVAQQSGLTASQLPIVRYDFDDPADRARCAAWHVDQTDLVYLAVVQVHADGSSRALFFLRNVTDPDRAARAAVGSARGLLTDVGETVVSESPAVSRQSQALYARYLRSGQTLSCHLGAAVVAEVMKDVRARFVDAISDHQMESGMLVSVRDLLQVARVPAEALEQLPLDAQLPSAIVATYGGRVSPDLLGLAEIRGALLPLKDPYSAFLTPDQAQVLNQTLGDTASEALGLHLDTSRQKAGQIVVLDVQPDSPAATAGLQPGDILLTVDGQAVEGLPPDLVSSMLGGTAGTSSALTFRRDDKVWNATLQRRVSKMKTVTARVMNENVGYIRLSVFASTSGAEVEAALKSLLADGTRALILDLRYNGGGYVRAAQQICSLFLPKGQVIMTVVGRGGLHENLLSTGPGTYANLPVVVLVNEFSASAAELTAGCLRDHKVAYLMGSNTFGKGSMQSPFTFPDQALLKLTIGRWYSPNGTIIDKVGLSPDFQVPDPVFGEQADGDVQLHKAYDLIHAMMLMPH